MKKIAKCERCPNTFELQRFCSHNCAHKLGHLSEEQKADLIKKRLNDSIIVDNNGCWIWQKNKSRSGYGKIKYRGRHLRAHRLSYELYNGKIPIDQLVMHLCSVRLCINPSHLQTGTQKQNIAQAIDENRLPLGEERHNTILTDQEVLEIKELLLVGTKQPIIAKKYNVSPAIISRINCGTTYSSVTKTIGKIFQKTEMNGAKLTKAQVIEIKKALKSGQSQSSLARQYNVSRPTISLIHSGKNWARVTID